MNFNQAAEHTGASSGLRLEAPRGKRDRTREGSKESRNFDTAPLQMHTPRLVPGTKPDESSLSARI